jgi:hypothetical protein
MCIYDDDDKYGTISRLQRVPAGVRGHVWHEVYNVWKQAASSLNLRSNYRTTLKMMRIAEPTVAALEDAEIANKFRDVMELASMLNRQFSTKSVQAVMSAIVGQQMLEDGDIPDGLKAVTLRANTGSLDAGFWIPERVADSPTALHIYESHWENPAMTTKGKRITEIFWRVLDDAMHTKPSDKWKEARVEKHYEKLNQVAEARDQLKTVSEENMLAVIHAIFRVQTGFLSKHGVSPEVTRMIGTALSPHMTLIYDEISALLPYEPHFVNGPICVSGPYAESMPVMTVLSDNARSPPIFESGLAPLGVPSVQGLVDRMLNHLADEYAEGKNRLLYIAMVMLPEQLEEISRIIASYMGVSTDKDYVQKMVIDFPDTHLSLWITLRQRLAGGHITAALTLQGNRGYLELLSFVEYDSPQVDRALIGLLEEGRVAPSKGCRKPDTTEGRVVLGNRTDVDQFLHYNGERGVVSKTDPTGFVCVTRKGVVRWTVFWSLLKKSTSRVMNDFGLCTISKNQDRYVLIDDLPQ